MKSTMKALLIGASLVALAPAAHAAQGDTLKEVQARGVLNCTGDTGSNLGFMEVDEKGNWKGLDIDLCKAMATAVLGSPDKLKIVPLSWAQRWPSLQSHDIDIVIKSSGATYSRDTELGLQFSMPYYLGTTKILAHKNLGISSLKDAEGGTMCVQAGASQEKQISAYAEKLGVKLQYVALEKDQDLMDAYFAGRCDMFVKWGPGTGIVRSQAENPDDHIILSDDLDMEPEVMISRQGDDNWVDISNWVLSAVLFAEQEGITAANVEEMKANPPSAQIGKFLGATPGLGKPLGLNDNWAFNVIKTVGNYSEIFERNLGSGSPYKNPRGLNALWNAQGVLYPLVFD